MNTCRHANSDSSPGQSVVLIVRSRPPPSPPVFSLSSSFESHTVTTERVNTKQLWEGHINNEWVHNKARVLLKFHSCFLSPSGRCCPPVNHHLTRAPRLIKVSSNHVQTPGGRRTRVQLMLYQLIAMNRWHLSDGGANNRCTEISPLQSDRLAPPLLYNQSSLLTRLNFYLHLSNTRQSGVVLHLFPRGSRESFETCMNLSFFLKPICLLDHTSFSLYFQMPHTPASSTSLPLLTCIFRVLPLTLR